jgi:DNA-binding GntR family transcriptional regulator
MYFIEMTRNQTLIQFYENIMIETYRLAVYAAIHHCSCRDDNIPQHDQIIKALMTENDEQISMALNQHINHSLITLTATLDKIPDHPF